MIGVTRGGAIPGALPAHRARGSKHASDINRVRDSDPKLTAAGGAARRVSGHAKGGQAKVLRSGGTVEYSNGS